MKIYRIRSYEEYQGHHQRMQEVYTTRGKYEKSLIPRWGKTFKVEGFSYPAGKTVNFHTDFVHQTRKGVPNWRETLLCPNTNLNNRLRASVHILDLECAPYDDDHIYITEQVTAFYRYLSDRFQNVTGSEFVGEDCASGSVSAEGIRHEDLTALSFPSNCFKTLLTFDCLEHIPDDTKAFKECYRVLSPSGNMLFSVPFDLRSPQNITRAKLTEAGEIEHILEPEYHGDPMKKSGCLCFRHYGWEFLDELKNAGFRDAYAVLYWSKEFCYLGGEQVIFVAKK